jgi:hypothetical protein
LEGSDSAIELPPLGDRQEAGLQGRSALPDKWTRRQESNLPRGFCRPVPGRSATPRCLAPEVGIELTIGALTVRCLTAWLLWNVWCWMRGSNSRPLVYKTIALPTELIQQTWLRWRESNPRHQFWRLRYYHYTTPYQLAIRSGLEPLASTVTGWRSNQLN